MNPDAKEFIPSKLRQGRIISYQLENNQLPNQPPRIYNHDQYNNNPLSAGGGREGQINDHNNVAAHTSNIFNGRVLPQAKVKKLPMVVRELEKFIRIVTPDPSLFDTHVKALVDCAANWMSESPSVPTDVVQKILDAAIFHKDFRYNGVRLCMLLNNDIRENGPLFNKALIDCCNVWINSTIEQEQKNERQSYTEDLTLFIGDLYSRIASPELGIGLLQLIKILVQWPDDYRMKVSAQILKLCGQSLDQISLSQHLDQDCTTDYIIPLMETCVTEHESISDNTRALVESVIHLKRNGWAINSNGHSNYMVSPVRNNADDYANYESGNSLENFEYIADLNGLINGDDEENYEQLQQQLEQNDYILQGESVCEFNGEQFIIPAEEPQVNRHGIGYDFGNSDDEQNDDVCNAFEQFLSNLPDE